MADLTAKAARIPRTAASSPAPPTAPATPQPAAGRHACTPPQPCAASARRSRRMPPSCRGTPVLRTAAAGASLSARTARAGRVAARWPPRTQRRDPAPHRDFSDLYEKLSSKGESASEAHLLHKLQRSDRGCLACRCCRHISDRGRPQSSLQRLQQLRAGPGRCGRCGGRAEEQRGQDCSHDRQTREERRRRHASLAAVGRPCPRHRPAGAFSRRIWYPVPLRAAEHATGREQSTRPYSLSPSLYLILYRSSLSLARRSTRRETRARSRRGSRSAASQYRYVSIMDYRVATRLRGRLARPRAGALDVPRL